MNSINHDDVFNSTTSWSIAGGSLTDSISFECSSTTPANHDSEDQIIPAAVDHLGKSPLLLIPPVPNGDPCEITLTFAQEYEPRQIYIRSTARVYEVYYTKKRRHDKEYLCTVRCGFAMKVEEVLQIPLTESAAFKSQVEPVKYPMEKMVKNNGNGRMNEDDWVEVKAGDDSVLPMSQLGKQDLYEATAEINDAEPCTSITLRLLSLQDKGCALVDEVYIFADPVDPSESEQEEASGAGNSSSSSLMAMFMPTILQLARGKDVRKEQDIQVADKSISTNPGTLGNSTSSNQNVNDIQQKTNCSKADHIGMSSPVLVDTLAKQVDEGTRVSGAEIKPATSCNNVETILDQLVNKVSSIETMLTRFEDQILKPINSIDARLQLVENKLDQLSKKSFESELVLEKNIHTPVSLGSDADKTADTNELDGMAKNTDDQLATCTNDKVVPESSSINISEDSAVVHPHERLDTILTTSEELGSENNFSGNEMISAESEIIDEEISHSLEKGSFKMNPKPSLSINDALASALTGLLSSHLITDGKYSQAKAPEFSSEDNSEVEAKLGTGARPDKSQVVAELGNSYSASEKPTSSQKEPESVPCIEDDYKEMVCGVREKLDNIFGGDDGAETVASVKDDALDEETVTSTSNSNCYRERENLRNAPANLDSLVHDLEKPNATTECESSRSITSKECNVEPEMGDVLKSVLGFEPTTSPVDFLSPVLDVKFSSDKQNSESKSFFEELFTAESKTLVDCNNEAFDDNLVSVEDEEAKDPPTDTLSSVEMDHYETNEMALNLNTELSATSLI